MTIGIEWFLIQNLTMNALILLFAARLAAIRTGGLRIFLSASLGCGYAVCAYLPWGRWLLGLLPRTVVCMLMVLVLCGSRRAGEVRRTARVFGFVWLATFLLGGTGAGLMYMLGAAGYGFAAALVTAVLGGVLMLFLSVQRNRSHGSPTAELTVVCGTHAVRFTAVIDTGNVLTEPLSDLPVIVVEKRMLHGMERGRSMRRVPFASVGGQGVLPAFFPDRVRINGKECDACVAVFDGQLCLEGYGLIPGRCMEDELDRCNVGEYAAPAVGQRRALHRRQSDAARTLHAAGGGEDHGSAEMRR